MLAGDAARRRRGRMDARFKQDSGNTRTAAIFQLACAILVFPVAVAAMWPFGPGPLWFGRTISATVASKEATPTSKGGWNYRIYVTYEYQGRQYSGWDDSTVREVYHTWKKGETTPMTIYPPNAQDPYLPHSYSPIMFTFFFVVMVLCEVPLLFLVPRLLRKATATTTAYS
jgi:hypothetical protein